ncbi:hypothetical protein GCM10010412_028850 [Nonomuraea recticatena]|uniref:Uncharacterized protein n=1 Tax=Nonomuraea recticatena TaxID=46178 RepID=A0ABP6E1T7_9ACTN
MHDRDAAVRFAACRFDLVEAAEYPEGVTFARLAHDYLVRHRQPPLSSYPLSPPDQAKRVPVKVWTPHFA